MHFLCFSFSIFNFQFSIGMKQIALILVVIILFPSCKSGKAAEEKNKILYSQWMVESSAMHTFLSNKKEQQLETAHWDYVPGLVANAVLKAWQQYPEKTAYYDLVKKYADHCLQGGDTIRVGESNLDDLAAGKIFFVLYREEMKRGNEADAARYKKCAAFFRDKLKYKHARIQAPLPGAGGFFHKAIYPNQMWLDGLYMGTALYAEYQVNFGKDAGDEDNMDSWSDIANQFKIIHQYTYNAETGLNYHGWAADPFDPDAFWARKGEPYTGCSPEYWGRGMGWYFAALVDVLEYIPVSHPDCKVLKGIVVQVADGLARHQDAASGCWFQLLQYDQNRTADNKGDTILGKVYNQCDKPNYLESSASSMFTYAFYKGIRIGVLNAEVYQPVADLAYKGLLEQFIRQDENNRIRIVQSCASAGLGPEKDISRTGTVNYYLCGKDVAVTANEGKAIGPFIMACLEKELRVKN